LSNPGDDRPPAPRTQLRRPTGTPEGAPLKVPPLPPMSSPRPPASAAARPMSPRPRPRPLPREAAPTLTERLAKSVPLWMLALTAIPIVTTLLGSFIPVALVQGFLIVGCLPSVLLIPVVALWQMGFLLHLWLSENELLTGRLVAYHLLSMVFAVWVWMYAMPTF
jgi:hypothetical protein